MTALTQLVINPDPGIQRDSTIYRSTSWVDGSWTRFYDDRPQKIGGYTVLDYGNDEIPRNLFSINSEQSVTVYVGRPSTLAYFTTNLQLQTSNEVDVTPAGFVADENNTWSFATVTYDSVKYILAVAAPNGNDISNTTRGAVYYGIVGQPDPLLPLLESVASDPVLTAGGITVLGNYIIVFDLNGLLSWNDGISLDGWFTAGAGRTTLATSKFVYGAPVKSGQSVSGIFWSLDLVGQITLQQTNSTDPATYTFVTSYQSTQSTLLSASSIVSCDPYFYWVGNNSFYWWNGAVSILPNTKNKEYFFSNVNRNAKEKVYGFVDRLYNEVWWLAPFGTATENTNAVITGVDTGYWFDTNNIPRASAVSSTTQFPYPLMASSFPLANGSTSSYPIWAHEYGWDQVALGKSSPIPSYIESNLMRPGATDPTYTNTIVDSIVPDIQKSGDMYCYFNLRGYPNSLPIQSPTFTLEESTEFKSVRQKASIFSVVFGSNILGGTYLLGDSYLLIGPAGDERAGPSSLT